MLQGSVVPGSTSRPPNDMPSHVVARIIKPVSVLPHAPNQSALNQLSELDPFASMSAKRSR